MNDCVRSLVIHAGMPTMFWVEALATATHLINRRPRQTSGPLTSYQLLLGAPSSYNHLRVFGCLCCPNQTATTPHKLSARPRRARSSDIQPITEGIVAWIFAHDV
jgi:hypothetical protein